MAVELLTLRNWDETAFPGVDVVDGSTVPWGIRVHVQAAPPPDPARLECWGIGPECGGLATRQPVHVGAEFFEWVIGTEPDVIACHMVGVTECWLTDPSTYVNPPADFGDFKSRHTSRAEIDAVIPPEGRLATLLSTPPALPPAYWTPASDVDIPTRPAEVDLVALAAAQGEPAFERLRRRERQAWLNPTPDNNPRPANEFPPSPPPLPHPHRNNPNHDQAPAGTG